MAKAGPMVRQQKLKCRHCGSSMIYYRIKRGDYQCRLCGGRFKKPRTGPGTKKQRAKKGVKDELPGNGRKG